VDAATGAPLWTPQPPPPAGASLAEELRGNGFHARLSDSLPLDRNASDNRHPLCAGERFDLDALPTTSVVMVFHNEWLSTLLRAVHSVLNRSPPQLLYEIVLVDDASERPWLGAPLEAYVAALPKVRLVRMGQRGGLVKARLRGAHEARGDTVTVLDSHIEVQPGWLEPLMQRIHEKRTAVVMPQIDSLGPTDFAYHAAGIGCTLGFLWNLIEHGMQLQPADAARRRSPIEATPTPTHAGGLFSVDRAYFWELGGYDTDFGFWGTENLEFSFRIWQCGGSLECAPCSRVYHLFRQGGVPYVTPAGHVEKNKLRTAALWMGEYGAVVRATIPHADSVDIGPLDRMRELQQYLQCRPFSWFLEQVYPTSIIAAWQDILHLGPLRLALDETVCLGSSGYVAANMPATAITCNDAPHSGLLAVRRHGWLVSLGHVEMCLDHSLRFQWCERAGNSVTWQFDLQGGRIRNPGMRATPFCGIVLNILFFGLPVVLLLGSPQLTAGYLYTE
jgi:polypeptide N-acetylgalactosaminyltransferase